MSKTVIALPPRLICCSNPLLPHGPPHEYTVITPGESRQTLSDGSQRPMPNKRTDPIHKRVGLGGKPIDRT
jgi:hypothetical protein